MKTKTPAQVSTLESATQYLANAAAALKEAGEPGLAMAVLTVRSKAGMALTEARYFSEIVPAAANS